MDPSTEFKNKFEELQGTTIGERQNNLNNLLNALKNAKLSTEDLMQLDLSINPRNKLEEVFKLIVFIQLKHNDYLFQILQGENLYSIGKLVKQKWFFRDAFLTVKADELVNDLFEKVSPITRNKIINKLSFHIKNEKVAQDFFNAILTKYGLSSASKLLPNCRIDFIKAKLNEHEVNFNHKQLLKIVKKDVTFAEYYFEKFCNKPLGRKIDVYHYRSVLRYIASNAFTLFFKLYEKYNVSLKLNAGLTRKIYALKKADVLKRPLHYYGIMNHRILRKLLGGDFQEFYTNTFPKSVNEFSEWTQMSYLTHLPPNEKYNLITSTFLKVYGVELFHYPRFVSNDLINIMPASEERIKWAKQLLKEDRWICYMPTEESIPILKEKIPLFADRVTRSTYLNYLIETCSINDDKTALLEVLKYFVVRHRNEDENNRASFLRRLNNCFKLDKLSEEHWNEINKLLKLFNIENHSFYDLVDFIEKYIQLMYATKTVTDEAILWLLKELIKNRSLFYVFGKFPALKKLFILRLPLILLNNFKGEELFRCCANFVNELLGWNKAHPKDPINPYSYPEIIQILIDETHSKYRDHNYNASIIFLTNTKTDCVKEKEIVMKLFWECVKERSYDTEMMLPRILKRDPLAFRENIDKIGPVNIYRVNTTFFSQLQFYSHLDIPQRFTKIFLKKLTENEHRHSAISALPFLLSTEQFLQCLEDYQVTQPKLDFDEENEKFTYQKSFVENLKYVDKYSATLPILKQFCIGDYLRVALGSLYCIVNYTSKSKTNDLLNVLLDRAVSVRKHGIFLTVSTRDYDTVYSTLKELGKKEKNASLRKFIFKRSFKYFCANPSTKFWELLKRNALIIKKEDYEAYDYFFQLESVPLKYIPGFIEFGWDCLKESKCENIQERKFELLKDIDEKNIKLFSDKFCRKILTDYLFKNISGCYSYKINEFCFSYLLSTESETNVVFVCDLMNEYIKKSQTVAEKNLGNSFIKSLCRTFREHKKLEYLMKFAAHWNKSVEVVSAYEEHLTLQLTILYLQSDDKDKPRDFAQNVSNLYNEHLQKYSHVILGLFSSTLSSFERSCFYRLEGTVEENQFDFYTNLMRANNTVMGMVLVLDLLPKKYSVSEKVVLQHKELLKEISNCNELGLKILYNQYVANLEIED